jgi:hypothetical protein
MLLWLAGAALLTLRTFTWEPRAGDRPSRRKRSEAQAAA